MALPKGVRYEWNPNQSVDYQLFPEEYFSGADVSIYFGDVWLDDLTAISFQMQERVEPIFGYASYTWDHIMRGARLVTGMFSIAFREAGYLNNLVLDHIGQLGGNAKPALAWLMDESQQPGQNGSLIPQWQAKARERVEELLARHHNPVKVLRTEERPIPYDWPTFDIFKCVISAVPSPGPEVLRQLAEALSRKGYYTPNPKDTYTYAPNGLVSALVKFQQDYFKLTPSTPVTPDGQIGVVGPATIVALSPVETVAVTAYDQSKSLEGVPNPANQAKNRLARYEAEIWGLDRTINEMPLRSMRRFQTYWYSGEYTKNLAQKGFDIYFSFGALDTAVANSGAYGAGQLKSMQGTWDAPIKPGQEGVTYPTTVKALRNVQIRAVAMTLDTSGRPVEEIYEFIAQDID